MPCHSFDGSLIGQEVAPPSPALLPSAPPDQSRVQLHDEATPAGHLFVKVGGSESHHGSSLF